jgi:hypothetical protein
VDRTSVKSKGVPLSTEESNFSPDSSVPEREKRRCVKA